MPRSSSSIGKRIPAYGSRTEVGRGELQPGSRLEIVSPQSVRFIFPEPDGGALEKLRAMHIGNRQFYRELGWGEKSW